MPINDGIIDSMKVVSDEDLLKLGNWTSDEKMKIQKWIEDATGIKAAEAIIFSLEQRLGKNYNSESNKIKKIKDNIAHFENLVSTIRSGLRNEYYQEHLNHMLRVALLANAIGKQVRCLNLDDDSINRLTIAGLVHDISYPLSFSKKAFGGIKQALEDCYNCSKFTEVGISYNMEILFKNLQYLLDKKYLFSWDEIHEKDSVQLIEFLIQNFDISWGRTPIKKIDDYNIEIRDGKNFVSLRLNDKKSMVNLIINDGRTYEFVAIMENGKLNIYDNNFVKFGKSLDEFDHGVLSAIEFLTYIRSEKRIDFRDVALAIASHNGSSPFKNLSYFENPLTVLLILCDELQEGGRLIGIDIKPLLGEIKLSLTNGIGCIFDYSGKKDGPSFAGRLKNLQRIDFAGFDCPLFIRTILPDIYDSIDIAYLLECMRDIISYSNTEEFISETKILEHYVTEIQEEIQENYDFEGSVIRNCEEFINIFKKTTLGKTISLSVHFRGAGLDFLMGYDKPDSVQFSLKSNKLLLEVGFSNRYTICEILNIEKLMVIQVKYIRDVLSAIIAYRLYKYHENLAISQYNVITGKDVKSIKEVLLDKRIIKDEKKLSLFKKIIYDHKQDLKFLLDYFIFKPEIDENEKKVILNAIKNEIIKIIKRQTPNKDILQFCKFIDKFETFYNCFEDKKTLYLKYE